MISRWLFLLARKPIIHALVRWGFGHVSGALPLHRVATTEHVIAFFHPRPTWSPHILLVPRRGIASIVALGPKDSVIIADILQLAADIVATNVSAATGYVLLVNGGAYQDVGQLHFHLTWETDESRYTCPDRAAGTPIFQTEQVDVIQHPHPQRAIHLVLRPRGTQRDLGAMIAAVQHVVHHWNLLPVGFSLALASQPARATVWDCFHLLSGSTMSKHDHL